MWDLSGITSPQSKRCKWKNNVLYCRALTVLSTCTVLYLYIRINIWSSRENDKLGKLIITFRTLRKEKFLEHLFYKSCMKDKLKETVFFLFTLTYHGLLIPVHINYLLFTDHLKIKLQFFDLINYKCLIILCVWINRYLCIAEIRLGVYSFGTHKLGAFTSHMIGGFSPNNLARCLLQTYRTPSTSRCSM